MTQRIRAHFDGRVLVPDEPVDLPVDQPLELEVSQGPSAHNGSTEPARPHDSADQLIRTRRERLRASAGVFSAPVLTDEALRRENMYDERL